MSTRLTGAAMFVLCTAYGCGGGKGNAMPPLGPTLEVVNHSSLVYRVTLGPSRVFQVHPGQRKCVRVGNIHQTLSIEFLALAGSRTHRTPPENLMSSPGWIVEIGLQPALDVLTLRPADPCME